jgi:hypothetical protein
MIRSIRVTAAVFAALALAGCSDASSPVDPSAAPWRNTAPAGSTAGPTSTAPDTVTARGIHTLGGGG